MNFVRLIAILAMITGCGSDVYTYSNHRDTSKYTMKNHNPIFDKYSKGFPSDTTQIPIVFIEHKEDSNVAGVCHIRANGHVEIEINKAIWTEFADIRRYVLIWHELGHCLLNLPHSNTHIDDYNEICVDYEKTRACDKYTPLSIMRWYIPLQKQIPDMCEQAEIDALTEIFCKQIGV